MISAPEPLYDLSYLADPLTPNAVYESIATRVESRTSVDAFRIPIRTGTAWKVRAGQVCRITAPDGPQVGDFNCWSLDNPAEHFWASRTRQLQAAHVRILDRLWSTLPYLRPLLTVTGDSLDYGQDERGGRCHDLLGSRCDPYLKSMMTGKDVDHHCHSNLVRAIAPFGLDETDVHDVLNVFQVTGLVDDRYFIEPCPARAGDYFEFVAEIDLLCALSTCPGGDLSVPRWGPEAQDNLAGCRPLDIEVFDLAPELLDGWSSPAVAPYRGNHGLPAEAS